MFRFIHAVTEAFTALGSEEWESGKNAEASVERVAANDDSEDYEDEDEIIFANKFSGLNLNDENGAEAEEDEEDGEESDVPTRVKKSAGKWYVFLRVVFYLMAVSKLLGNHCCEVIIDCEVVQKERQEGQKRAATKGALLEPSLISTCLLSHIFLTVLSRSLQASYSPYPTTVKLCLGERSQQQPHLNLPWTTYRWRIIASLMTADD